MGNNINRRSLITGLISFVAAPAIVRVESLMPMKVVKQFNPEELLNELTNFAYNEPIPIDILYGIMLAKREIIADMYKITPVDLEDIYIDHS